MENNKIAIIDIDSILFAACYGKKLWNPQTEEFERDDKGRLIYLDKNEDEIGSSINTIMHEILEDSNADSYIAFVKGKNTAAHRYNIKNDYKSNRPKESPSWWEYARQFIIDTWDAVSVDTIEVDDAVNITRLKIPNSYMVAIDKDLLNLEGTHYNWKNKEWVTVNNTKASELFWLDMICGQSGDGISGLKGKGKTYFYKNILPQVIDMYGNDFYEKLPSVILDEYINHYTEEIGIQEYYKNYTCLKILDHYEGFKIPTPIKYREDIEKI